MKAKKLRHEAARFAERMMECDYVSTREKGNKVHFGKQEVRELLDFIYGGPPRGRDEVFVREYPAK